MRFPGPSSSCMSAQKMQPPSPPAGEAPLTTNSRRQGAHSRSTRSPPGGALPAPHLPEHLAEPALAPAHPGRLAGGVMVVPLEVEDAVDEEPVQRLGQGLPVFFGFGGAPPPPPP